MHVTQGPAKSEPLHGNIKQSPRQSACLPPHLIIEAARQQSICFGCCCLTRSSWPSLIHSAGTWNLLPSLHVVLAAHHEGGGVGLAPTANRGGGSTAALLVVLHPEANRSASTEASPAHVESPQVFALPCDLVTDHAEPRHHGSKLVPAVAAGTSLEALHPFCSRRGSRSAVQSVAALQGLQLMPLWWGWLVSIGIWAA